MQNIPINLLVNLLFGIIALTGATLVLLYRNHFTLHNGVAILLFAVGFSSCSIGLMAICDLQVVCMLYWISRATIPIFLLLFSEYILKVNYHIVSKLLILSLSWIFLIGSFFQNSFDNRLYVRVSNIFFVAVLFLIITKLIISLVTSHENLIKKYLAIYLITILVVIVNEILKGVFDIQYNSISAGISALVVTHGVILIITTGGYNRLRQKLPPLLYILLFSLILCGLLKFSHPQIESKYLWSLLVLSTVILSLYYLFTEISKSPKKVGSTLLISRLLSLPLHDQGKLLEELRQWEEINELHFVDRSSIEGNFPDLNSLFVKVGRAIHKYQLNSMRKVLAADNCTISGIEVAQFYLKKFDCQSLFQISDKGDFIAIKYSKGLNPALYSNEISLMTKIVFLASSNGKSL